MKSVKGVGIIAAIVLLFISLALSFAVFAIFSFSDKSYEQSIDESIAASVQGVEGNSLSTLLMRDGFYGDGPEDPYNGMPARKVYSYYLSTSEEIHIRNQTLTQEEIRGDIKDFLKDRCSKYLGTRSEVSGYRCAVKNNGKQVETYKQPEKGGLGIYRSPIPLHNGTTGTLRIEVRWTA